MKDTDTSTLGKIRGGSGFLLLALLGGAMALVCREGLQSHWMMWANDVQLGPLKSSSLRIPDVYTGIWVDFWWIGINVPACSPSVSNLLATVFSPETYLKIYTPFTMLVLGFSAWVLFRQLKFAPIVCVLGGLAAGLNMHCFSNGCWGTGDWNVAIAMAFLAVAALVTDSIRQVWIKAILAGLAVGMSVMEGFDSGAILSVYAGIFSAFFFWITESTVPKRLIRIVQVGALMVVFSALIATSTLYTLVGTQVLGVAGAGQSAGDNNKGNWFFSTQGSLPKLETLRVIIPGIFGYRMEEFSTPPDPVAASLGQLGGLPERFFHGLTDKSSAYWGRVFEDPMLTALADLESSSPKTRVTAMTNFTDRADYLEMMRGDNLEIRGQIVSQIRDKLQGRMHRHSGNGEYAGVLTALFAIFALLNSFRPSASPYTAVERRMVWFWGLAALFSLVMAWGRFSFLYAWFFQLPGASLIRNPTKFMHPFVVTWVILAGFGLEALHRCYLRSPAKQTKAARALQPAPLRRKLALFDLGWIIGLAVVVVGVFVGFEEYAGSKQALINYLVLQGFPEFPGAVLGASASGIAAFSIDEAEWFAILFTLSAAVVVSVVALVWARRWTWLPWSLLCGIMIFDMSRADLPWVRYFNYDEKYSMNDVTKALKDKPYEHRVVAGFNPRYGYDLAGDGNFSAVIHWWIENDFPYRDIQTLEIDQMPRAPVLDSSYLGAFPYGGDFRANLAGASRLWKLTNTRYLLAATRLLPVLNSIGDPQHPSFRIATQFDLVPKPGYVMIPEAGAATVVDQGDLTTQISPNGSYALIEDTDILPRVRLYSAWLTPTNDQTALQTLTSPEWDPAKSVLVSPNPTLPPPPAAPVADPGAVSITSYQPKDIKLQADAKAPAVLLYNDRTAEAWRVWVDGKQSQLLRCNYIMRGVFLSPGAHTVEFRFQPTLVPLCITLSAFVVGILLAAWLLWSRFTGAPAPVQSTAKG